MKTYTIFGISEAFEAKRVSWFKAEWIVEAFREPEVWIKLRSGTIKTWIPFLMKHKINKIADYQLFGGEQA